jgi:nitroreductase
MSSLADSFDSVILSRKSVRAFQPRPVPQETIEQILSLAGWAPSNCNTQPWKIEIVSGQTRDLLSEALVEDASIGRLTPDMPYLDDSYPDDLEQLKNLHMQAQCEAFGVSPEGGEGMSEIMRHNMCFHGAPHAALVLMPKFGNEREAADVGMFAQSFMLALTAHGLASVPQTSVGFFAEPVRRVLQFSEDYKLLFAISFGYEEEGRPPARMSQERNPLESWVRFHH